MWPASFASATGSDLDTSANPPVLEKGETSAVTYTTSMAPPPRGDVVGGVTSSPRLASAPPSLSALSCFSLALALILARSSRFCSFSKAISASRLPERARQGRRIVNRDPDWTSLSRPRGGFRGAPCAIVHPTCPPLAAPEARVLDEGHPDLRRSPEKRLGVLDRIFDPRVSQLDGNTAGRGSGEEKQGDCSRQNAKNS